MERFKLFFVRFISILAICGWANSINASQCTSSQSEYYLVVLVNARHLDYSCPKALFRTIAKHPSDCSKNGDVGHAWIYLKGMIEDEQVYIEGGHSGELGVWQPKYFDGVMNYIEYGYAFPTEEQLLCPRFEPNPIKYLWASQCDGFFQEGSGGHRPTYAAKINISPRQFDRIYQTIMEYNFQDYAITRNQCSSFVVQIASLAGLKIDCDLEMPIDQEITVGCDRLRLWTDRKYARIKFSSPDIVERSLIKAVNEGRAKNVLEWYLTTHPKPLCCKLRDFQSNLRNFPERIKRLMYFR